MCGDEKITVLEKQVGGRHYKGFTIEPVEYIIANNIPYCEANVIKYVSRHRFKGGIEDLRKAKHYLEIIAEKVYGEKL